MRIFNVTGGSTRFTLTNLTLQNGLTTGNGGALQNDAATTTISNTRILSSTGQFGGGLRNQGAGTLTVYDSLISGNIAQNGGGVSTNSGVTTLMNSTVAGNTASGSSSI